MNVFVMMQEPDRLWCTTQHCMDFQSVYNYSIHPFYYRRYVSNSDCIPIIIGYKSHKPVLHVWLYLGSTLATRQVIRFATSSTIRYRSRSSVLFSLTACLLWWIRFDPRSCSYTITSVRLPPLCSFRTLSIIERR